jgi:hypothetical protein
MYLSTIFIRTKSVKYIFGASPSKFAETMIVVLVAAVGAPTNWVLLIVMSQTMMQVAAMPDGHVPSPAMGDISKWVPALKAQVQSRFMASSKEKWFIFLMAILTITTYGKPR